MHLYYSPILIKMSNMLATKNTLIVNYKECFIIDYCLRLEKYCSFPHILSATESRTNLLLK